MSNVKRKNSKMIRVVLAFLVLLLVYGSAYGDFEKPGRTSINLLFLRGEYDRVVLEADRLIGMRRAREEIWYLRSLSFLKLNRFDEARKGFEYILYRFPGGKRVFDSHLGIGDSFFLKGDIDKAIEKYKEILNRYNKDNNLGIVYFKLGNCYKNRGLSDKATWCFKKVETLYPLTFEAKMLPSIAKAKSYFTVQVGAFKNRRNAEKLVRRLSGQGYVARLYPESDSGGTFYKVRTGKTPSRHVVDDLASRLKRDGYKTKICQEIQ